MKKSRWSAGLILGVVSLSLVIPVFALASPQKATIKEILGNPDKYDQKVVKVEGKVVNLKLKVSKKGNPYTTFSLMDEEHNTLKVFIWGHLKTGTVTYTTKSKTTGTSLHVSNGVRS